MNKVVYIIPGLGDSVGDKKYAGVVQLFKNKGFKTVPVKITWNHKVMSDYVREFLSQFDQHESTDEIYLFGFSFGAVISLISSEKVNPKMQFLCSLSPYFKEDLPDIKCWWKVFMGINRIKDFEKLSFDELTKNIKCKTYLFAGTKEPEAERKAKLANQKIRNSELFIINGAKHDISQKVYADRLVEVISKI